MISRRRFFETVIAVVAGVIGLSLIIPLAGYAILPALKRRETGWVDLGPIEQLKPGEPQQIQFLATRMGDNRQFWCKALNVLSFTL